MRDLALFITLFALIPLSLKRPMVSVAVYIVVSVMSPHQLSWGIGRDFPWAWIYAVVSTISALRWHGDRIGEALRLHRMPLILLAWTAITTAFALDVSVSMPQWITFLKVQYGIVLALICVRDLKDVRIVIAALAGSVGFYGLKGFIFMLGTAGQYRVNGPLSSLISDNNHLALALAMVVPLLYWLTTQTEHKWVRLLLWTTLVGCVFSALGTYSRGGFLSLSVVAAAMVARSPRKAKIVLLFIPVVAVALAFMPDAFWDRMNTINDYKEDSSATGRIQAWITSLNAANARITGGGFSFYVNWLSYVRFSPPDPVVRATHSIYFQALGDHGWIGLGLFLAIFVGGLVKTGRARKRAAAPNARAHNELLRALQISLLAYFTGGAFLSLAFWDFAYYLVATISVLHARRLVTDESLSTVADSAKRPNIFERPHPERA